MTNEQIEKLCKVGVRKKFTAQQLARYVMERPYSLCAADATIVMREYQRKISFSEEVVASISPAMKLEANPVIAAKRTCRAWTKLLKPGKFPKNVTSEIRTPTGSEDVIIKVGAGVNSVEVKCIGAGGGGGNLNYTPSKLNRSRVKEYALDLSEQKRAGKFRRVSKAFIKRAEAEFENVVKSIGGPPLVDDGMSDHGEVWDFLNHKQIRAAVSEQLNRAMRRILFKMVLSHPSLGKTLK